MRRKDNRPWRKLVKKLRRKRIRQKLARERTDCIILPEEDVIISKEKSADVLDTKYFLTKEEWIIRDKHRQLVSTMKLAEEERLEKVRLEEEKRIREEWEKKENQEKLEHEEHERLTMERLKKQGEDYEQFLDFLCGDIETPPLPFVMPEGYDSTGQETCKLFVKTGACRFFDRCKLLHPTPVLSQTLLVPNFFSHFLLQESLRDEYDMDLGLEYEKSELQIEFLEFYQDVLPEFQKHGKVIQFKVCCNFEAHLRGNVYIQYDNIRSSVEAFRTFNARFYNGRQISLQFVKIDSWRTAICWSFLNRHCVKGGSCNYLHVFRNPTKEFVSADRDFKPVPSYRPSLPEQNRMAAAVLSSSQRMSCPDITPVGSSCMSSTPSTPRHLEDRNRPLDKSSGSNDRSSSRHQPSPSRTDRKRTKSTKRKRSKSRKSKKHKRSKSPGHKKHKSKKSKKTKHKED